MLTWLIVSQLLALVSLLPWLMIAGLSVAAFDAGFRWKALAFVVTVWSYPLVLLITTGSGWYGYLHDHATLVLVSGAVPMLMVAPLLGYFVRVMLSNMLSLNQES